MSARARRGNAVLATSTDAEANVTAATGGVPSAPAVRLGR